VFSQIFRERYKCIPTEKGKIGIQKIILRQFGHLALQRPYAICHPSHDGSGFVGA
jgi:hypothetical protein